MLRGGPKNTVDFHNACILCAATVIFRLRAEGHVIVNTPMPSGTALYTLISEGGTP